MNIKYFLFSLLILFNFCNSQLVAQIKPTIHFTEDDGLPNNKVMDIVRDKGGFLWIATENGLAKYDGDKFIPINDNSGLPLQMVWALACGEENEIYAGLHKGGLAIIKGDKVKKNVFSKNNQYNWIRKLYYSNFYKKLFVGTDYGLLVLKDTVLFPVSFVKENIPKQEVLSISGHDSIIFFSVHDAGIYKLFVKEEEIERSYAKRISKAGPYACLIIKNNLYSGSFNKIFKFDLEDPTKLLTGSEIEPSLFIWNFSPYKDGKFLIGGLGDERFSGDVVLYDPIKNSSQPLAMKHNIQSVNAVLYDSTSRVIWIGRDNGLTAVFESPFEYFNINENENITDIGFEGDSLFVLTDKGVNYLHEGKISSVLSKEQVIDKINYWFNTRYRAIKSRTYVFDNEDFSELVSFIQTDGRLFISTQRGAISVPDMKIYLPFAVGTFSLINNNSAYSFIKYNPLRFYPSFRDSPGWIIPDGPGGKVFDISKIIESKGIYYCMSSINGLYGLKNQVVFRLSEENSSIDNYLVDIDKDKKGNIWCLSANGKMFEIHFSDSLFIKRKLDLINSDLIGNSCKWIKFIGDYLLIGTNKGLNVIKYNNLYSEHPSIEHFYNSFNGYDYVSADSPVSNERDKVYLHISHEVVTIDTNFISSGGERIYIKDLLINGKEAVLSGLAGRSVPYNNKQISFLFNTIKYPVSRNIKYRYRVNAGDWVQSNQVELHSLRPNNYKVSMEGYNQEDGSKIASIFTFTLMPPYWRSVWFILLFTISLSFLLFLFMRIRINRIRKQQEEKTRMAIANAELQLRSLQIQMNPHFIFNALNSIQYFILSKNTKDSMKFLGDLASIIRTNLENATEEYISVASEAEFLKKYIKIEKMRFGDKLKVQFRNNIKDINVMIPPMLIQPLIENAIKHGIGNRDDLGEIKIDLNQNGKVLTIIVEDNGVGREFAKTLRNIEHSGRGLKIISQRLNLLNKKYYTDLNNISFIDLHDNGIPLGTKVLVNLLLTRSE